MIISTLNLSEFGPASAAPNYKSCPHHHKVCPPFCKWDIPLQIGATRQIWIIAGGVNQAAGPERAAFLYLAQVATLPNSKRI